jgi:hypothetical protein
MRAVLLVLLTTSCGGNVSGPDGGPDAGGDGTSDGSSFDVLFSCPFDPSPCTTAGVSSGMTCGVNGQVCSEWMACGNTAFSCCYTWRVADAGASCNDCPAAAPLVGAACNQALRCTYTGITYCDWQSYECDNGAWATQAGGSCDACPTTMPANGDPCTSGMDVPDCYWASSCHDLVDARCVGNQWSVTTSCP